MEGAAMRLDRVRELTWWGAMLPHLKKPIGLKEFVGRRDIPKSRAERVRQFHAAWDKIDRALGRQR